MGEKTTPVYGGGVILYMMIHDIHDMFNLNILKL